jgi:Flp pilus assembly protein TadG
MGIMLPVMLGITGLALDGSLWYAQKRSVQAIADTAAYSVVLEVQRSGDTNLAKTAAKADAVTYGLDEATGDTITFNIPPKYGTFANTAGYYEVIIERPATIFLAGSNPPCLLASDPSQKDSFKVNNGTVSTTGCNVHVNSIDSSALNVAKNGTLDADPIYVAGDYVNKGTITSVPTTGAGSVQDPLADLPVPSFSGCATTSPTAAARTISIPVSIAGESACPATPTSPCSPVTTSSPAATAQPSR